MCCKKNAEISQGKEKAVTPFQMFAHKLSRSVKEFFSCSEQQLKQVLFLYN